MLDILEKRLRVIGLYPNSPKWRHRVNNMSDSQVFAIFRRNEQLEEERTKLYEEYSEFYNALRSEDSSKLDELFKQESLF